MKKVILIIMLFLFSISCYSQLKKQETSVQLSSFGFYKNSVINSQEKVPVKSATKTKDTTSKLTEAEKAKKENDSILIQLKKNTEIIKLQNMKMDSIISKKKK